MIGAHKSITNTNQYTLLNHQQDKAADSLCLEGKRKEKGNSFLLMLGVCWKNDLWDAVP